MNLPTLLNCLVNENRVLKWWCHKNEISEIMGFVGIFWKDNVQEAYLLKMSISVQIVSEIVAQLCLENSVQTLLNFLGVDPQKIVLYEVCISCRPRPRLPLHLRFKKFVWQADWRGENVVLNKYKPLFHPHCLSLQALIPDIWRLEPFVKY